MIARMRSRRLAVCALAGAFAVGAVQADADSELERYASADLKRAKLLYRVQCQACHTLEADGPQKVGPSLHGVVGRRAAAVETFKGYSEALRSSGITWTPESLERWLEKPSDLVPGNVMAFIGVPKEQDRINLVAYLMQEGK
jgi:cytochrome c